MASGPPFLEQMGRLSLRVPEDWLRVSESAGAELELEPQGADP